MITAEWREADSFDLFRKTNQTAYPQPTEAGVAGRFHILHIRLAPRQLDGMEVPINISYTEWREQELVEFFKQT